MFELGGFMQLSFVKNKARRYLREVNRACPDFSSPEKETTAGIILLQIKTEMSNLFTLCKERPCPLVSKATKSYIRTTWNGKTTFFRISIYVAGYNIRWDVDCNFRSKEIKRNEVMWKIRIFMKENGLQNPKNHH